MLPVEWSQPAPQGTQNVVRLAVTTEGSTQVSNDQRLVHVRVHAESGRTTEACVGVLLRLLPQLRTHYNVVGACVGGAWRLHRSGSGGCLSPFGARALQRLAHELRDVHCLWVVAEALRESSDTVSTADQLAVAGAGWVCVLRVGLGGLLAPAALSRLRSDTSFGGKPVETAAWEARETCKRTCAVAGGWDWDTQCWADN